MSSLSIPLMLAGLSCLFQTVSADVYLDWGLGGGFGGLLILILDILAIFDVLRSGTNSTTKLLWVIVILLLPLLGPILWLCIGRKRSVEVV